MSRSSSSFAQWMEEQTQKAEQAQQAEQETALIGLSFFSQLNSIQVGDTQTIHMLYRDNSVYGIYHPFFTAVWLCTHSIRTV
jgi:hypothetical protein